ncbi:MAG: hypothetical protein J7623_09160 [Chitinophaga sp.]|uniref:hypothetical protein n=1 Tax=Chitinophaga sp. TaxID=1869181 RepID=UPI001B216302|nr:hypothetical protein [Chitinophaga sp.]MBO9728794.1 hypothetical protein [Chitinophaga sp.]
MKSVVEYFNLAGQFTNPATFIWGALVSAFLAFVVAVILVILLRKRILVDRSHKWLRYIAYTYFFLLPVLAGFFAFKWGFFNSVRKDIQAHRKVYAKHVPAIFDEQATAAINALFSAKEGGVSRLSSNQLIDTVGVAIYNVYGQTLTQQAAAAGVKGQLASFMLRTTKGAGLSFIIKKYIRQLLTEKIGLQEEVSAEVMQTEIATLLKGGLFVNIAIMQVDHFLKGLQKSILITFLLILAIPCIEVAIAHYLLSRKLKA